MYYNNYICQKLGKIENLKIKKNKITELKKNEVRLKVLTIGLNYVDTLMIKGEIDITSESTALSTASQPAVVMAVWNKTDELALTGANNKK